MRPVPADLKEAAERLRVPLADGTLVATPDLPPEDLIPSFLAASDVLGTAWFGAVLAANHLGAERIIAMSRHEPRQRLAIEFGATDIVEERGDNGVARVKELTGGLGAHSVIEAVGTQEGMMQAIRSTRPGGHVCYVGVRRYALGSFLSSRSASACAFLSAHSMYSWGEEPGGGGFTSTPPIC